MSPKARTFTAILERDPATGLYVGSVPGFPGAHTQAATLDELNENLREVLSLLLEEGDAEHDGALPQGSGYLSPTLLRKIASDTGLTVDEFLQWRR